MKRVPLKRKIGLKRGTKCTLRKSRLKPMSRGKSKWMALYREACARDGMPEGFERHHPFGRRGKYLMAYIIMPAEKHRQIHDAGTLARQVGWLQPPYEGRGYNPDWPRPWAETNEQDWPQSIKRIPGRKLPNLVD